MRIEKYRATDGYRWRAVSGRGKRIIADGGEAYSKMSNLNRAVKSALRLFRGTVVIRDLTAKDRDSDS